MKWLKTLKKHFLNGLHAKLILWKVVCFYVLAVRIIVALLFVLGLVTIATSPQIYVMLWMYVALALLVWQWVLLWNNAANAKHKAFIYTVRVWVGCEFILLYYVAEFAEFS